MSDNIMSIWKDGDENPLLVVDISIAALPKYLLPEAIYPFITYVIETDTGNHRIDDLYVGWIKEKTVREMEVAQFPFEKKLKFGIEVFGEQLTPSFVISKDD